MRYELIYLHINENMKKIDEIRLLKALAMNFIINSLCRAIITSLNELRKCARSKNKNKGAEPP